MNKKEDIEFYFKSLCGIRNDLQLLFRAINNLDWTIYEQKDLAEYKDEMDNGLFKLICKLSEKLMETKENEEINREKLINELSNIINYLDGRVDDEFNNGEDEFYVDFDEINLNAIRPLKDILAYLKGDVK